MNVFRLVTWAVRRFGVRNAIALVPAYLNRLRYYARERRQGFDAAHGTDTTGIVDTIDMGLAGPAAGVDARMYAATDPDVVRAALDATGSRFEDCAFVDVGSGKGRVLLLAVERPFQQLLGVELSPKLHAVASQNVARVSERTGRALPIELIQGDARDLVWPDCPLVVFFFHPFGGAIMDAVIDRLETSLAASPRAAAIIYVNDVHRASVARSGAFRLITRRTLPRRTDQWWSVWSNQPRGEALP